MVQTLSAKTNPNDTCPCGSGKKYKHCCGLPDAKPVVKGRHRIPTGAVVIALIVGVAILFSIDPQSPSRGPAVAPRAPAPAAVPADRTHGVPQPRPALPGEVWSEEHGHFHTGDATETVHKIPQPEGDVPPGKIWSEEHGHWHDTDA